MSLLVQDRKLLKAFRKGDGWALEEVYRFYREPLMRYLQAGFSFESRGRVCRYSGNSNRKDLEWVLQETFVRAFESRTRRAYDGQRPFLRYLQTIARNLILRDFNRNRRLTSIEDQTRGTTMDFVSSPASGEPSASPEQVAEAKELQHIIGSFMSQLNAEEASFVQLRFIQQLTQEATADAMGRTRAKIKLLESSLRARFLDLFRNNGYFVECAPKPRWTRKAG